MEIEKIKNINRIALMRTIDKKRTISSEQGHYNKQEHQRKFTIDYFEPKSKQI